MLPVNRVFSNAVIFIVRKSFVPVQEYRFPVKKNPVIYQEQQIGQGFYKRGAEGGLFSTSLDRCGSLEFRWHLSACNAQADKSE
ncbi:MAG: hypothetical protein A2043_10015 [Candidatus Schekmanbacteria bacterium GWA2_38_9]|uniref:Uncharacterized protein n=1 Tax=Candidatus Schekmanbacteria bacterium RIFCSPLOWO2_12_FULL_38_15 TaxID=1817883 RepID=A0A1F7SHM9_9BACT|nr:MAG: hypothetical protein A2043_10015 [Candidatus Schekmanbacteria bacterium GWA2_38_9]OGL49549.1 MAG: hypothetical protein A3H37_02445 [Candidatus Schekmanbacteria bacterium RIFCSPLOWO2_02_FULL_38_14]OGL52738.1 MAG: hypothetical protein A3G31_03715 [Candidatus Schekmanbacteria bacterium RIFCSPLOWO2_12_FULL_38_15]